MKYLYDDTYKGDRWRYGCTYRPVTRFAVPDGWIIQSLRRHKDFTFGTVDYPFELTEAQMQSYELRFVEKVEGENEAE